MTPQPDREAIRNLQEFPEAAVRLLWNRGLREREAVTRFLEPDWERDTHDPFLFRDMRSACQLVWDTLQQGEPIVVYGDYDADGVTGSVVLVSVFRDLARRMGQDPGLVSSYIPHREREGYGIQTEAVERLLAGGMRLLVSVDCGIGSAREISAAQAGGAKAIVVDHHQVPETVPDCLTIHPSAPGETYPFRNLAAVGVAFKLACGLAAFSRERGIDFPAGYEKWMLDLVAIATVTDVVPLLGENRVLERFGLIVLNKTRRLGLAKLMEAAGLDSGSVDTRSIGFGIGPRINAASRMDHASVAFECLMAESGESAATLAERLNQINLERQRLTEQMSRVALAQAAENRDRPIHVISGDGWSAGVVGIIAGRMTNETGRPSFVFGREGDRFVGSGRSVPEFDVMAALDDVRDCLFRYGGHPQACGMTIVGQDNFERFRGKMEERAGKILEGIDLRPAIDIDAEISASQVDWRLVECLGKMEPFGEGNPKPRFLMAGLQVVSLACIGKDSRHVRMGVRGDSPREMKTIGFGLAEAAVAFPPGSRIDSVVELGINEWNGRKEIQVQLIDIRPAAEQGNVRESAYAAGKAAGSGLVR
ncbi:single-stranded-DNA-specific exonuclease RecJ [Candidatus Uhrbacteria bacterium]|nr:single-stranded-DNA-specific exonuclease RecJ [Candidatus Uhrbacteria bacterium]